MNYLEESKKDDNKSLFDKNNYWPKNKNLLTALYLSVYDRLFNLLKKLFNLLSNEPWFITYSETH